MKPQKVIAVLGGRFDPITRAHLIIGEEVLKIGAADEIWLSIEEHHQWRPIVAEISQRQEMVKLAINNNPRFKIDMTPHKLGGTTETITVMRNIKKNNPQIKFIFVMGSDQLEKDENNLPKLYKWSHWKDLKKEVKFLIIMRKGFPIENIPSNAKIITDPNYEPLDDSATRVRNFIKIGKSIHGLVPDNVEKYIKEKKLYK